MLFRLSEVFKSYGAQQVLRGLSFQINAGEHIGLVGRNGAGKTTVFRLIGGEETADQGTVVRARSLRLGLLEQHVHFEPGITVHEAALGAFGHLQEIEHEMRMLEHRMSHADESLEAVLDRYSELQQRFEQEGGFEYSAKAEAILQGLGFDRSLWQLETDKLSGGQQNRLGLARLLLAEPDVLLLDEPTNHLDVAAVEWLEEFLRDYRAAYIIVSHDRYFLDRAAARIIEIEAGRAASYTGNYSAYLIEREARREAQQRAYDNQQQLIAKTEEFIRRNLAGQKTKQAKSRRKMLEKLERVESARFDQSAGDFRLRDVERAGTQVLKATELAVGYPEKTLARDISFALRRGECLGVIGPNGSGKTTLIRTLLGKLGPLAGEIQWGTNIQIGYYAQQLDDLDGRNEIIMELRRVAPSTATAGELRSFLAKFLFTGDDVYKHVDDLSGGEKGRLALAKLIYSRFNVLLLDEPTNHLDIPSREALEEALDAYQGTIITISHDRFFLDRVATQILALEGVGGVAEHYDGDYTEYHDWKQALSRAANEGGTESREKTSRPTDKISEKTSEKSSPPATEEKPGGTAPAKPRRGNKAQKIAAMRDPRLIETEISQVEEHLAALSHELAQPGVARDRNRLQSLNTDYKAADTRLRSLYEEWERVASAASVKATNN